MLAAIDYEFFTVASVCGESPPQVHSPQITLGSITTSSQEVTQGSLFVPLTDKRDGHDFIADALDRGAAAFFLRKNHPIRKKLSKQALAVAIEVKQPLLALAKLAAFHRNRFAPLVIGVTGSNGKTTTKEMLAQIFRSALGEACVATEKNYNNHIGLPFTLFSIRADTRVAIVEMGMNHAGEISHLSGLARPHASVISSVGHAHIEFFKSRAGIAAAKAEIMNGMQAGSSLYVPQGIAELPTIARLAKRQRIRLRKVNPRRITLAADANGFSLNVAGEHVAFPYANAAWVSNLALAAAVALDAGIEAHLVAKAAENFKPATGRMQVRQGNFTVIDDGYNANPDSAVASIDSALQIAAGKPVVCIFGDFKEMGKFSRTLHEWTGKEAAKKGVAAFYGVGMDMKHAVASFRKTAGGKKRSYFFPRADLAKLVQQVQSESRDAVLLVKGSRSMKMEEIVELIL